MTHFEELEQLAADEGIPVDFVSFQSERLKGLYIDGNIALSDALVTDAEKASILAEEIGHHFTSSGNILDMDDPFNRRQELIAREYGHRLLVDIPQLVTVYESGCRNIYEMSEHLGVTEDFLREALNRYQQKYGARPVSYKNYLIFFVPSLSIMHCLENPEARPISEPAPTSENIETRQDITYVPRLHNERVAAIMERIRKRNVRTKQKLTWAMKRAAFMQEIGIDLFDLAERQRDEHLL